MKENRARGNCFRCTCLTIEEEACKNVGKRGLDIGNYVYVCFQAREITDEQR